MIPAKALFLFLLAGCSASFSAGTETPKEKHRRELHEALAAREIRLADQEAARKKYYRDAAAAAAAERELQIKAADGELEFEMEFERQRANPSAESSPAPQTPAAR